MRSMPAETSGGKAGDLPESKTRNSRRPVEKVESPSMMRRSLVVVISGKEVVL